MPKNKFNYDIHFIITCCQNSLSIKEVEYILLYINRETLDIETTVNIANQHGVLPIVYQTLKKLSINNSSKFKSKKAKNLLIQLKIIYKQIAYQNMLMSAELIQIIKLLEENNIEALAFKGPSLAEMIYGDITLRQYVDLDILVDRKDIFKAAEIITANNYYPDEKITFLKNNALLNISSDFGFTNIKNNIYIELHWKLFRKKIFIKLDKSNVSSIRFKNREIRTLKPNLLLLYLCIHGSKHMWERIEWILDIDKIINNTSINWKSILYYANKIHSTTALLLGLSLSQELFQTTLPSIVEEKIKRNINVLLLKTYTIESLNKNSSSQYLTLKAMLNKFNYHSKLYNSWKNKINYYFSNIFKITPDDIFNINLPNYLTFLYFIIRPFRLIRKYLFNNF